MNRSETYDILKCVSPALAVRDIIPAFSCFCFSKRSVFAYDDLIAIHHPFESPIRGAVKGKMLLDWMGSAKGKELDFKTEEQQVTIKCGRSHITMPILPREDFLFSMPEDLGEVIPLDKSLIEAITQASVSVGLDPSHAWRLGVTLKVSSGTLKILSCDNLSATRVKRKTKCPDCAVIIPPRFCDLVTSFSKSMKPKELAISSEWIVATFENGVKLFCRAGAKPDMREFKALFKSFDILDTNESVEIPKGLTRALERSLVVVAYNKDEAWATLNITNGKLGLLTRSDSGEARDRLKIGKHKNIEVKVTPHILLRALPQSDRIQFTDSFIAAYGKQFEHMIATVKTNDPTGDGK